jgi:hypothetical protein
MCTNDQIIGRASVMVKFGDGISSRAASGKQGYGGWNGCNYLHADSFIVY